MTFEEYKRGAGNIPETMQAWQVFGVGLENVGRDGKPIEIPVYEIGDNQLLARVDAAGLCFSDTKIMNLGSEHPRLYNRDLVNDPIVMGHEAAVTVVKVGSKYEGKYHVGQRFVVQADAYYKGKNLAFGYMLPGALEEYTILGQELLEGDDGVYLIPMKDETSYSEAALSEPWACVVCAYRVTPRKAPKAGGVAWVIGTPAAAGKTYTVGALEHMGSFPAKIYLTDVPCETAKTLKELAAGANITVIETASIDSLDLDATFGEKGADDIFLLGGTAELVEKVTPYIARLGLFNLVIDEVLDRPASIDVGRIHYDYHFYQGCTGTDVSKGYGAPRGPELQAGGKVWMLGGAGPMGQMHVQLAIEMNNGPQTIVASDIDTERLNSVMERFGPTAASLGKTLICLNPMELGNEGFDAKLREIAPDGFEDVVCLVPVPALVNQGSQYVAKGGWLNIFAGVARGTMANLELSDVALRNVRYTGTSGSSIDDMRKTLSMAEGGELSTNRSVAAIGGIEAAWLGLKGVKEAKYTGKVIIYPQIKGLPLTALEELADTMPEVAAKLSPQGAWTREAEQALIEKFLP